VTAVTAVLVAARRFASPPTESQIQYLVAQRWSKTVSRSNPTSLSVRLDGKSFGIANVITVPTADGGWALDGGEILPSGYFAYPPGKQVPNIDEAFVAFRIELSRTRQK